MKDKSFGSMLEVCTLCKKIYAYKEDERLIKIINRDYPCKIIDEEEM